MLLFELIGPEGSLKKPESKDFDFTFGRVFCDGFILSKNTVDLNSKQKKDAFGLYPVGLPPQSGHEV